MFSKGTLKAVKDSVPSIISQGTHVLGDITTEGEVQIDGKVEGNIRCQSLIVADTGEVTGKITSDSIMIHGVLTGTVHGKADLPEGDRRLAHPRFQGENLERNVKLVRKLDNIARDKKCTVAQLVLAWLLAQGKDIVAIPGTKRKQRVDENREAAQISPSQSDLELISAAAPPGAGAGTRYPADAMKRIYL